MYDPGELDQRVTFRTDSTVSDGMGGVTATPSDIATVWAKVKLKGGKEQQDYERVNAVSSVIFVVRYRTDIDASMRIVWQSVEYNIRDIRELGGRKLYLEFEAERGVPQ